jgi:hypothetical protein
MHNLLLYFLLFLSSVIAPLYMYTTIVYCTHALKKTRNFYANAGHFQRFLPALISSSGSNPCDHFDGEDTLNQEHPRLRLQLTTEAQMPYHIFHEMMMF